MRLVKSKPKLVIGCVCCLLIAGGSILCAFPKRTLLERWERVYDARKWDVVQHRFYWLSDSMVLYTNEGGTVNILDVTTGRATKVPKLEMLTAGMLIWHGSIRLSLDRKLILYINDANTAAVVCTTAGAVIARWSMKYSFPNWYFGYAVWSPDSRHWICVYFKYHGGVSGARVYDTHHSDAANTPTIHISPAFAEQCDINRAGAHSIDIPSPPKAGSIIRILTGRSISDDRPTVSPLSVNLFDPAPSPDGLDASISPDGKYILWQSASLDPEYVLRFHKSWPLVSRDRYDPHDNVWISDQRGRHLRYIGRLPTRSNRLFAQSDIEWLPSDSGISYYYHNKLYVYRIE
jgi:hypothetical protein